MILFDTDYKNIIISTSRNIDTKYDFIFINDISKNEIKESITPHTYNSRYMEFIPNITQIEVGLGKIKIILNEEVIYEDIYYKKGEETEELIYKPTKKKYVYKND